MNNLDIYSYFFANHLPLVNSLAAGYKSLTMMSLKPIQVQAVQVMLQL